ncbi:exported protein of unknown function [Streptomyces ambofaciens ATCC 23877]|uniref:Lipoprotein n=1 Tax=Streptomyces ambofaciens (strain ATCC 23877 / 3486 / DSM 40053 / JCM 4204 / NBRC 12836 / NRRL B-2516) TaxID=278992 RepID=A0A0K2B1C6_STRA7|nr:hypothetical protein [Streptomyces ambofaciens]AKZ59175.1 exported protein of unknown function [Streptomyces ambofaciens ATCC 23877]WNA15368.1 hypothetical protein SAMYPH_37 [Streptomyces phage Samy]
MKRLTRHLAVVLALVAALAMLAACDIDDTAQPSCVEVDVDAPKVKKPTGPKITAPALRIPTKRK